MDENYFKRIANAETDQAKRFADILIDIFNPSSVVDFGCATGLYLKPFADKGIKVTGYDSSEAALGQPVIPGLHLQDITQPMTTDKVYDLAICLEVLEHIPEADALRVVDNIVNFSEVVVFSAAQIGQKGTGHINCQPLEYWQGVFEGKGYKRDYPTGKLIVDRMKPGITSWLESNLMIFMK